MATPKQKADIGLILIILFIITFITGINLHLKKDGFLPGSHHLNCTIHWVAGLLMAVFTVIHGRQFKKMLDSMKKKFLWFWADTRLAVIFILLTLVTGGVKLLSPVKIPHLGLWHYFLGLIMTVFVAIHLLRGIPAWNRLRKIKMQK